MNALDMLMRRSEAETGGGEEEVGAESNEHDTAHGPQTVMLFLFVCLLIGCACRFLLEMGKNKLHVRVPYSVVLLILGGVLGAAAWKNVQDSDGETTELLTLSLTTWANINPHLILFIFLPALIYECAMGTNFYIFSNHFFSALVLAGPGMLVQTFLIALVAKFVLPYEWTWVESLLFGGILSATDPVAVIALLKELGVLPDLRVLVEAESLLNDGTAIVVYQLCLRILTRPESTGSYIAAGFQMTLGAPALGIGLFLASFLWLRATDDPIQDTMVTVCTAYLGFLLAEGTELEVSGVLTVVTIGVLMAGYGNTQIKTEEATHMLHAVWGMIVYCADTVIFVLAGAIIVDTGFLSVGESFKGSDWGYLILLYILLSIIRGIMVVICSPFLRYYGYGLQPRTCSTLKFWKSMFIVTWGGLRGAVGLVLALAVSVDAEVRDNASEPSFPDRVLLFTAGMVVLTTLVNAAFMERVIGMLGMMDVSEHEKELFRSAIAFLDTKHTNIVERLQNQHANPHMAGVDWGALEKSVGKGVLTAHHASELEGGQGSGGPDHSGVSSFPDDGGHEEAEKEILGRYLISLRASYTSQWNGGMLATTPYTKLLWALDRAMDHAGDENMNTSMKFEWGWLEQEGAFEFPWWVRFLHKIPLGIVKAAAKQLERGYLITQFEIVCGVIRAHDETSRCEFRADMVNERFMSISEDSARVREVAEHELARMEAALPEVAAAVRTRQACCVVLSTFRTEVDMLHAIAQITSSEHERLEHAIHDRLNYFHSHYPQVQAEVQPNTLPILRLIPEKDFDHEWASLKIQPQDFNPGDPIFEQGEACTGVWLVVRGVVKWVIDKDDGSDLEEEMLMTGGTSMGDQCMLLALGGHEAKNRGRALASTNARLYLIPMEAMKELLLRHPSMLNALWKQTGPLVFLTYPNLFYNLPTSPALSAYLEFGHLITITKGVVVKKRLHHPLLVIQGSAKLADSTTVGPFTFISPDFSRTITFADGGAYLSFKPEKQSIIGRRSEEMARPMVLSRTHESTHAAVDFFDRKSSLELQRILSNDRIPQGSQAEHRTSLGQAPPNFRSPFLRSSFDAVRPPMFAESFQMKSTRSMAESPKTPQMRFNGTSNSDGITRAPSYDDDEDEDVVDDDLDDSRVGKIVTNPNAKPAAHSARPPSPRSPTLAPAPTQLRPVSESPPPAVCATSIEPEDTMVASIDPPIEAVAIDPPIEEVASNEPSIAVCPAGVELQEAHTNGASGL